MHLHDSFVTLTVPQLAVFLPLKMRFNCPVHVFFCTSHAPFLFPTIANGSAICFIFGTVSSWHPCPRGSLATLWGDRCIDPEGSNWSLNFLNLHTILHKSFFGSEYHRTTGSYLVLLGPIKKVPKSDPCCNAHVSNWSLMACKGWWNCAAAAQSALTRPAKSPWFFIDQKQRHGGLPRIASINRSATKSALERWFSWNMSR